MSRILAVTGVVCLLLVAGCLGGQDTTGEEQPEANPPDIQLASPGASDTIIRAKNIQFQGNATIQVGQVVGFTNGDTETHRITIEAANIDEQLQPGKNVALRFNDPGTYTVTCSIHPRMETTVTVKPSS